MCGKDLIFILHRQKFRIEYTLNSNNITFEALCIQSEYPVYCSNVLCGNDKKLCVADYTDADSFPVF